MKITIKNRRIYKGPGEWICRGRSPLGNPFVMKNESQREYVIDKYRDWLSHAVNSCDQQVRHELNRLYGLAKSQDELILICWCAPKDCHGDVISAVLKLWHLGEKMESNETG